MVTTPLDMKYIYKRERCLERRRSLAENASVKIPDLSGNISRDSYKYKVESFVRDTISYKDALNLLETLYRDDRFDLLESATQRIINDIIPTVESVELPNCIDYINSIDIGNINKDRLVETVKLYKSIDRIRKNHKNLSKRFELESFVGKSDKERCYRVCEMVCTYDMRPFIKYNIALEELTYLGYMDGHKIPDADLVKYVSEYFLMIAENTREDIESYKRAIVTSKVLSEKADEKVHYLFDVSPKRPSNKWSDKLEAWLVRPGKKVDTLVELARTTYGSVTALNTILETINDFNRINETEFNTMSVFEDFDAVNGDEAHNIMSIIKENHVSDSEDLVSSLRMIWEAELNDSIYDDGTKEPQTFTSDEIDKFTMHNMVSDAMDTGEFLDQLEKTSMKEAPVSITRILSNGNDTDLSESTLIDHVDANGYISMNLRSYVFEGKVEDIYQLLESSVNCINNMLYGRNSRAYYTLGENRFDISIRSRFKVVLSEAQENKRGFSNFDKHTLCEMHKMVEAYEKLYNESALPLILDKLKNDRHYAATVTPQEACLVYDIMSPYLSAYDNAMDEFAELCRYEANPKYDRIKSAFSDMVKEHFDFNEDHIERLDFCARVMGIDEGAIENIKKATADLKNPTKKKTNMGKEEDLDHAPKATEEPAKDNKPSDNAGESFDNKKAINSINDAKLAWQGIKAKLKGASAKEQEMSRDLDMEFNHMLKTMKMTYGTDHREEIITGEVNHSLSKIIKIGIGLAGIGVAAHSAVLPVIGAVALFARSKYTTNKEKKMIIDEIDIELQVLEREIQRAESSGSTKKYRQLLTIQKNLQRRRQEIYYGLTKKGQRVPMQSTEGLRPRE